MAKYEILTFQKNLDRAEGYFDSLGQPKMRHGSENVVFLEYGSEAEQQHFLPIAQKLLKWAVPVTVVGGGDEDNGRLQTD